MAQGLCIIRFMQEKMYDYCDCVMLRYLILPSIDRLDPGASQLATEVERSLWTTISDTYMLKLFT